jgi:hypothetical protein
MSHPWPLNGSCMTNLCSTSPHPTHPNSRKPWVLRMQFVVCEVDTKRRVHELCRPYVGSVFRVVLCRQYKGTSGGLAVQFGACKDSQTAADTSALSGDNTSTGAATYLFIQAIEHLSKRHAALTYALHSLSAPVAE